MKKTVIRIFAMLLVILSIASMLTSCGGSKKKKPSGSVMTVRCAVICPVTGPGARTAITEEASISAAEQHMKEDNFLDPAYEIEFIRPFIDDEDSPDKAPVAANLAISMDPHVVIGSHKTVFIMAYGELYEEAEIPIIGIISGPAPAEQGWKWFHYGTCTDADAGATLAEYLANVKGFKNILVMARNDEGGKVGAKAVIEKLEEYGVAVPADHYMEFATDETDFAAYAMRAKELQVDCVLTYGLGGAAALTCYDQIEQIYGPIPDTCFYAGSTSFAQPSMAEMFPPDKLQGIIFPSAYIHDPDNNFVTRFENQFKENDPENQWPGDNQGRVYDACWNIAAAINLMVENDGYLDPDKDDNFRERLNYWLSQLERQGVQGEINYKYFTDTDGSGRIIKNANIGEWQSSGQAVKIYPK